MTILQLSKVVPKQKIMVTICPSNWGGIRSWRKKTKRNLQLSYPLNHLFLDRRVYQSVQSSNQLLVFSHIEQERSEYSQAFMIVCSLMTMSVVSALGRETLDAIAVASVSRMILIAQEVSNLLTSLALHYLSCRSPTWLPLTNPSSHNSSAASTTISNPSKTLLFSTCPRKSRLTAS